MAKRVVLFMIHRRALDPIEDNILNRFALADDDVFDTSLLRDHLKSTLSIQSNLSLGDYSKSGFSYKLNEKPFIHFAPKVTVKFNSEKNEVLIQQEYTLLDMAYQRFGFMIMLVVGAMFLFLTPLGIIIDLALESKPPISNWHEFGSMLVLLFFLFSAYASIRFFIHCRERLWSSSKLRTIELLNLSGVKSIHSYDQTTALQKRYSRS